MFYLINGGFVNLAFAFDKELETMLSNKSNEEKLAILHLIKTELKDVKSDLVTIKRLATDYEEKVFLKVDCVRSKDFEQITFEFFASFLFFGEFT